MRSREFQRAWGREGKGQDETDEGQMDMVCLWMGHPEKFMASLK